jgi:hypothetical protein
MIKAFIFTISLAITFVAYGYSGVGAADVRDDNGIPCFSITKEEEKKMGSLIVFNMLSVYVENNGEELVWRLWRSEKNHQIPFDSETCFSYGKKLPDTSSTESATLEVGRIYAFSLSLYAKNNLRPHINGSMGRFCLIPTEGGKVKIHPIQLNHQEKDIKACQKFTIKQ